MNIPIYENTWPDGVLEISFTVTPGRVDSDNNIKISELARMMELATERHLSIFGMGRSAREDAHVMWVIAFSSLEIERLPKLGEKIALRIWPSKNKAMFYLRKYGFYTESGEPLVSVSSLFLLMDTDTRKAVSPLEQMKLMPAAFLANEPDAPKMTMKFPSEFSGSKSRTVDESEIDKNGHLNNAYYLEWAQELLAENYPGRKIKNIWIQYNKELMAGETVVMHYADSEKEVYIKGTVNDEVSFMTVVSK